MRKLGCLVVLCLMLVVAEVGCNSGDQNGDGMETGVSALVALTDAHISGYMGLLVTLAATAEVRSGDWDEMSMLLTRAAANQVPALVWFVSPDGWYYAVNEGFTGKNLSDRAYFAPLMAGKRVLGDLVVSKATGNPSVIVAAPVYVDNTVIGGLGASIFLDDLSEIVADALSLPENYVFSVATDQDQVALHSNPALILGDQPQIPRDAVLATSELTGWHFALAFEK